MASTSTKETGSFKPALIIVDMQNDFCPPSGSLAVDGGRSLAPLITSLSHLPFPLVVATQDWHPRDHISFATNHPPPNNEPLTSSITLRNPAPQKGGPGEKSQKLWPVHCVQGTEGAEIIEELEGKARIDLRVRKGMEKGMEMYSVFANAFGHMDCHPTGVSEDLVSVFKDRGITHVYTVGVAGDYCVLFTAVDAKRAGFVSYVVEEGTKCVDMGEGWEKTKKEFEKGVVQVVGAEGEEVRRVKDLKA